MKARLLALAAALSLLGAGAVKLFYFSDATPADGIGLLEMVDRSTCTVAACNAAPCKQAQAVLDDAGTACTVGFSDCSMRIGNATRAMATAQGVTLGPQRYQRVRLIGMRCAVDGGFAYGVPVDDAGWPVYAVATTTPLCVRAPLDGGTDCLRSGDPFSPDPRFFGTGNVFPVGQSSGSQCEPVECSVFAGDDPETSL